MRNLKCAVALGLCLSLVGGNVCYAATAADAAIVEAANDGIVMSDYITDENREFFNKLMIVFDEFTLDDNGILGVKSSLSEIQEKAGFTDDEMAIFNGLFEFNKTYPAGAENIILTRVHVSDWKIYLTQGDVQTFLAGAAAVGPAAIVAALSALGSTVPGVGTVVGAILGVVAAGDLCYLVLQAISANKGIYIGVEWNGVVPSYVQGLW